MATRVPDPRRNAIVDSIVDALDAGAGGGIVRVYTGTQPADADSAATGTLLVTITLDATAAFGAAASGTATCDVTPEPTGTAVAAGTAGWFRALDSDGVDITDNVIDGSVTATGGGGDMEINNTSIEVDQVVNITAWTVTMPAG
jgi:hypothetical protein